MIFSIITSVVQSFGYKIHFLIGETVSDLLQTNYPIVHGNLLKFLIDSPIFGENTTLLGDACMWADQVKRTKEFSYTAKLHYVSFESDPPLSCGNARILPVGDNLLTFLKSVVNPKKKIRLDLIELKLAIHLIQDLFQPLHLTSKLKGGNGQIIRVNTGQRLLSKRSRKISLHSYFDSVLFDIVFREYSFEQQKEFFRHGVECQNLRLSVQEICNYNCEVIWKDKIRPNDEDIALLKAQIQNAVWYTYCFILSKQSDFL